MNKKLFLILVLGAYLVSQENTLKTLNPDNSVVAFDFHGVLVDTDYPNIYKLVDTNFAKNVAYIMPKAVLQSPWWVWSIFGLLKQYPKSAIFSQLAKNYSFFQSLVPTITRMTNQQKIKPGIVDTLEALRNSGYSVALASNITAETLADLDVNGPLEVKEFVNNYFPVEKRLIPSPENNMLHKPQVEYFEALKTMFPEKAIVFFDDKKSNRDKAIQQGMLAFDPSEINRVIQTLLNNAATGSNQPVELLKKN